MSTYALPLAAVSTLLRVPPERRHVAPWLAALTVMVGAVLLFVHRAVTPLIDLAERQTNGTPSALRARLESQNPPNDDLAAGETTGVLPRASLGGDRLPRPRAKARIGIGCLLESPLAFVRSSVTLGVSGGSAATIGLTVGAAVAPFTDHP